jgi:hypothetical protein
MASYYPITEEKSSAETVQMPVLGAYVDPPVIISRGSGDHALGLVFP